MLNIENVEKTLMFRKLQGSAYDWPHKNHFGIQRNLFKIILLHILCLYLCLESLVCRKKPERSGSSIHSRTHRLKSLSPWNYHSGIQYLLVMVRRGFGARMKADNECNVYAVLESVRGMIRRGFETRMMAYNERIIWPLMDSVRVMMKLGLGTCRKADNKRFICLVFSSFRVLRMQGFGTRM